MKLRKGATYEGNSKLNKAYILDNTCNYVYVNIIGYETGVSVRIDMKKEHFRKNFHRYVPEREKAIDLLKEIKNGSNSNE